MKPDELLVELGRWVDGGAHAPPPDDLLRAYRERRLSTADEARLEAVLAESRAARERLATLADMAPPRALRQRVLDEFDHAFRSSSGRPVGWRAAVALAASILVGLGLLWMQPGELPADSALEIATRGLAVIRSRDRSAPTLAYPDTPIEISARAIRDAPGDLELGLYRVTRGRLERLRGLEEVRRGVAVWRAPAHRLVGDEIGTHLLYVVAARRGDLPASRTVKPGRDPREVLEQGGRRQVYPQTIEIAAAPEQDRDPEESER